MCSAGRIPASLSSPMPSAKASHARGRSLLWLPTASSPAFVLKASGLALAGDKTGRPAFSAVRRYQPSCCPAQDTSGDAAPRQPVPLDDVRRDPFGIQDNRCNRIGGLRIPPPAPKWRRWSPLATSHSGWMHALSSFAPRPLRSDLVCDDRVTRARRLTSIATASVGGLRRCLPVLRRSTRGQIRRYRTTGSLANSMPALIAHALVCTGLPAIVTVDLYAVERIVAVAGRTAASRSVLVGMSCEQVPPRCNADQREAAGVALQRRALPPGPLLGRVARARRRGGQQPSPGFRDPVTSNPSGGIRGDIRIRRRHREAPAAECDAGCNSPPAAPGTPDASGYRLSAGNRGCGDGR